MTEKTTISVLIPKDLVAEADKYGINRSEVSRQAIKNEIAKQKDIYNKQQEIEALREEKEFGSKLRNVIIELKMEVNKYKVKADEINTDPFIKALIQYSAEELNVDYKVLNLLMYNIMIDKVLVDDIIDETRESLTEKLGD